MNYKINHRLLQSGFLMILTFSFFLFLVVKE
jgi:hypothetical protein